LTASGCRVSGVESREDKAQNPFATNGRYNLFRPLTALLDLPKMPVFTGK
jgi:hypothetical protein